MIPMSTMPRLTIEESTGRRMKSSASCICGSSGGRATEKADPNICRSQKDGNTGAGNGHPVLLSIVVPIGLISTSQAGRRTQGFEMKLCYSEMGGGPLLHLRE